MWTLLSGFYQYLTQKDDYYILIVGLDNAGKTTYLEQTKTKFCNNYKMMNPSKITTTVGCNIGTIDIGRIRLNFWDLGGQEELQSLWDKYYADCHGIIYIIDSADRQRLEESWITFDKMLQSEQLTNVPLLVSCNKQDLDDCMTVPEIKRTFNRSTSKIGVRDCMVLACSALSGDGINESISWMKDCIIRNSNMRPPKRQDIG
jgi:ADP-ribosylation factor related protein 1